MLQKVSSWLVLVLVFSLLLGTAQALERDQLSLSPGAGTQLTSAGADRPELVDCPEELGHLEPDTVTLQVIDHTFYTWRKYVVENEFFLYLEEPEARPLSAEEARELLDASGEWLHPTVPSLLPGMGIFGRDERTRVTSGQARNFPWNTIGYLEVWWGDEGGRGTGFLVSPHVALTNAHNVWDPEEGGWYDELEFVPGRTQDNPGDRGSISTPFGVQEPVDAKLPRAYQDTAHDIERSAPFDFAAIFFEEAFPGISTFMPLEFDYVPLMEESPFPDVAGMEYFSIAGYPQEVQGERESFALWHSSGPVLIETEADLWALRADASEGNSGGPIWAHDYITDTRSVVGVISHVGDLYNSGPRFAAHNRSLIDEWRRWTPGDRPDPQPDPQPDPDPDPGPDPGGRTEVLLHVGQNHYSVNGETFYGDAAPYIYQGRTFVPVRFVAEEFAMRADWGPRDGPTEWVELHRAPGQFGREGLTILMFIGYPDLLVTIDGVEYDYIADAAAQISYGRTYLPLRAIGEILGVEFDWGPRAGRTEWVRFTEDRPPTRGSRVD